MKAKIVRLVACIALLSLAAVSVYAQDLPYPEFKKRTVEREQVATENNTAPVPAPPKPVIRQETENKRAGGCVPFEPNCPAY